MEKRREKFSASGAGASANEIAISLYVWRREKFLLSGAGASVNETTISLFSLMYRYREEKIFIIRRGSFSK
ncbi:MAG: hypothetical protein F6K40_27065 [Okeania sp. SIO3I5]|uniref:hypothetical protein n=1 Tax=Okeania sp. SIO3I5 TaxID=2607805 RepID=UPI0013B7EA39|nr:hypothetical protein [Okeania sp. SIO3I5]NEQ39713.1 hypothetical protein [Okeania sp. SIO3I5]